MFCSFCNLWCDQLLKSGKLLNLSITSFVIFTCFIIFFMLSIPSTKLKKIGASLPWPQ